MMNIQAQTRPPAGASEPTLYDDVYYPGHVYEHTHPNHLATLATIYGLQPVSVERCRVLELGCGVGGNLLPMAFQYPDSEFIGIDLSGVTIERGMRNVAALDLNNIKLMHCDIMDVDASFGQFDYIIAHGVYSWVPPEVRRKMMTIFKQRLSPNGICYVSYNAHPYSHLRDMTRDMMLYHTRHVSGMKQKTAQARAIMKFLSEGTSADTLHGKVMRDQYKRVTTMPEEVLFHDDLNEIATAFLLHQVVDEAGNHGLQYLSDTDFSRRHVAGYSDEVCSTLQQFPDTEFVARDQYQDFIDGNGFRRTLLCHDNIALDRGIDRNFVTRFHLLSNATPVSADFCLTDMSPMEFKTYDDTSLTVSKPILKAAHRCLGKAWPRALSFAELLAGARDLLGSGPNSGRADDDEQTLIGAMYILACSGEVTFLRWPPFVVREVSDRPQASLLARKQAESGTLLTNVLHQAVRLADDRARYFLQLLDGTRTMEQLAAEMTDKFGDLPPAGNNSGDVSPQSISERVQQSLATVSKLGLLVS
ncbi:class I SAM-dependent methyltransferase [Bradyrhizobium prioriisuperbiae]|uniref:class I SAM-dependent methyltransferase n=1 Tax=Bradyrhizobium prioriisuperbiae TaxID=2854389 RepID=UPI0028E5179F|nr:class I SAM-dependent methyltransferase [Bradyrhizobium prioritasuperba]